MRKNAGHAGTPEPLVLRPAEPRRDAPLGGRSAPLRASRGLALGVLLSTSLWAAIIVLGRALLSLFR